MRFPKKEKNPKKNINLDLKHVYLGNSNPYFSLLSTAVHTYINIPKYIHVLVGAEPTGKIPPTGHGPQGELKRRHDTTSLWC